MVVKGKIIAWSRELYLAVRRSDSVTLRGDSLGREGRLSFVDDASTDQVQVKYQEVR